MGLLEKLKGRSSPTTSTPVPDSETGIVEPRVEQGQWNLGVKTQLNTNGLEFKIAGKTPDAPPDFRLGVVSPLTFTFDAGIGRSFLNASVKRTPRSFTAANMGQMGITDDISMPKIPIVEGAFFRQENSRATVDAVLKTNLFGISTGRVSLGVGEGTSIAVSVGHTSSRIEIGARIIRQGPFIVVDPNTQTSLVVAK